MFACAAPDRCLSHWSHILTNHAGSVTANSTFYRCCFAVNARPSAPFGIIQDGQLA